MRSQWAVATGVLALSLALGQQASASNGPKPTFVGVRAMGRGGVDFAFADDASGAWTNPAGMAFVYGNRVDTTWVFADARTSWTNTVDGTVITTRDESDIFVSVPAYSFGATFDPYHRWDLEDVFDIGVWGLDKEPDPELVEEMLALSEEELRFGSPFRFGIGIFPITGGVFVYRSLFTEGFGTAGNRRGVDWENYATKLAVTPSFAYRVAPWVSFGLNLQLVFSSLEIDGGVAQPSSILDDDFETASAILSVSDQVIAESDMDDAISYGFSWRFGIMLQPAPWLSIGLVYQDQTYMADYLGRVTSDSTDEINRLTNGNTALLQVVDPRVDPALGFSSEYDLRIRKFNFPRMFGLGIALRPHERISFGIDYQFINWSDAYNKFRVRLTNGSNPNMDLILSEVVDIRVPLNYEDQHVVAAGVTVLVAKGEEIAEGIPGWSFIWRGGWNYGENPVPANATQPQVPVIFEHHLMTGFTVTWGPFVELSAGFEYGLPNSVQTGNHVGDDTLSFSEQEAEVLALGVGFGVNF